MYSNLGISYEKKIYWLVNKTVVLKAVLLKKEVVILLNVPTIPIMENHPSFGRGGNWVDNVDTIEIVQIDVNTFDYCVFHYCSH